MGQGPGLGRHCLSAHQPFSIWHRAGFPGFLYLFAIAHIKVARVTTSTLYFLFKFAAKGFQPVQPRPVSIRSYRSRANTLRAGFAYARVAPVINAILAIGKIMTIHCEIMIF
jgi:hypothetical protein